MLFPINDRFWTETADFVQSYIKDREMLIAPLEFEDKFPGRLLFHPFSTFIEEQNFQWAIIHKGRMDEISPTMLKRISKEFIPVFANEVFVVFSSRRNLEEVDPHSPHIKSFWERMKERKIRIAKKVDHKMVTDSGSYYSLTNYSSLSVDEIKREMDERYATKQAYTITCLWDKVRAEELNRKVIEWISPTNDKRILEVGCGIGGTAAYISECKEFIGTDISEVAVSLANEVFGRKLNFRFITMDAMDLKFNNNEFDVVIAKEIIEHLPDPLKAMREVLRALKGGGLLVVTSPNRDSLHLRVNRMLGYPDFKCSFDHVREFTFQEAIEMLNNEGFIIKDTGGIFLQPYWGIPGIDEHVRHLTDNNPEIVEMLRELGKRVGGEYAFCFAILAVKP